MGDVQVRIRDDAKVFVKKEAARQSIGEPNIVRKALEAYRYLLEVREADGKVVLRRANGVLELLVDL